ncbi:MAG: M23 family metallopeptidase [Candidatus Omnitrophota bacterium]
MAKLFAFLKNTLVIISILFGLFLIFNELYFLDIKNFVSPLNKDTRLIIRNDAYGDGYFAAPRRGRRKHAGLDFAAAVGTNVCAVKSGWVLAARESKGLGKFIEIYHKNGLISVYGHLDSIKVKLLQRVRQGEVIGTVGKTGNANYKNMQPHLHFEIIKDGLQRDPTAFFPNLGHQRIFKSRLNGKKAVR